MSAAAIDRAQAGVEISLRIGQRVRHSDFNGKRVTGIVRGLHVDSERGLMVECVLDEPIVIAPLHEGDHEIRIYRQCAEAHEFAPFDDRDALIAEMLTALRAEEILARGPAGWDDLRALGWECTPEGRADREFVRDLRSAAIAKATGSAA